MHNAMTEPLVSYFPFWEHLTQRQKEELSNHTVRMKYPKGAVLHNGSENCVGVLLIQSGQLRVSMLSEDGREITLYRLYPGDICILSASCVLEAITFDVSIDAQEDTELYLVNAAVFRKLSEENIYVQAFGYQLATMRFSDVMWAMQQILFMRADQRLAVFLWDEMAKSGSDEIRMTQDQVAKYMGSAREVVSRLLKYFSSEGIVELFRGGIRIIDKEKLRALI